MNSNVVLIGKVAQTLTTRDVQKKNGETAKVGTFLIVLGTGKNDANGEEIMVYYQIETWSANQQKQISEQLKKGELVAVRGNLDIQEFESKDGGKKRTFKIQNPEISFLGDTNSKNGFTSFSATGRLTNDIEVKTTLNGKKVANFSVAASNSLDRGADGSPKTQFLNIEVWNEQAETMAKYLLKAH